MCAHIRFQCDSTARPTLSLRGFEEAAAISSLPCHFEQQASNLPFAFLFPTLQYLRRVSTRVRTILSTNSAKPNPFALPVRRSFSVDGSVSKCVYVANYVQSFHKTHYVCDFCFFPGYGRLSSRRRPCRSRAALTSHQGKEENIFCLYYVFRVLKRAQDKLGETNRGCLNF